jgi:uncharacterized protein with HEPN domain
MTPPRTYVDNLRDIVQAATYAESFVADVNLASFRSNTEKIYAVTRALEIIGEAARQIPLAVQAAYPDLPWQEMIGMRNVVIHQYFGEDSEVLWRTVREDLPPLRSAISALLAQK